MEIPFADSKEISEEDNLGERTGDATGDIIQHLAEHHITSVQGNLDAFRVDVLVISVDPVQQIIRTKMLEVVEQTLHKTRQWITAGHVGAARILPEIARNGVDN